MMKGVMIIQKPPFVKEMVMKKFFFFNSFFSVFFVPDFEPMAVVIGILYNGFL